MATIHRCTLCACVCTHVGVAEKLSACPSPLNLTKQRNICVYTYVTVKSSIEIILFNKTCLNKYIWTQCGIYKPVFMCANYLIFFFFFLKSVYCNIYWPKIDFLFSFHEMHKYVWFYSKLLWIYNNIQFFIISILACFCHFTLYTYCYRKFEICCMIYRNNFNSCILISF